MFTFKINFLGGKGVKKAITKIAKGTLKTEGKVWFTDLSKVNNYKINVT